MLLLPLKLHRLPLAYDVVVVHVVDAFASDHDGNVVVAADDAVANDDK